MATIRIYKLVSTGVATANAAATITIPRNGVITAVSWAAQGTSGAAVASGLNNELSTSSVSTIYQNDTPGNSISSFSCGNKGVNSSGMDGNLSQSNLGVPINAGDKLYIHQAVAGTAPANCNTICHVAVMH